MHTDAHSKANAQARTDANTSKQTHAPGATPYSATAAATALLVPGCIILAGGCAETGLRAQMDRRSALTQADTCVLGANDAEF